VIQKGLAAEPSARHPSVTVLVDALERGSKQPRRRLWVAMGVSAALGGALLLHQTGRHAAPAPMCVSADAELAPAWNRERREALTRGFVEAGGPPAESTAASVSAAVDRYASEWTRARADACSATRIRGTQSETVMDQRMRCLDRLGLELGMLTDRLAHPESAVLGRAAAAVEGLAPPSTCSASRVQAGESSTSRQRTPDDEPALLDGLARASTEYRLGRFGEALRLANETRSAASARNAVRTESEALVLAGRAAWINGDPRAETDLFDAYAEAEDIGAPSTAAAAAAELVAVAGAHQRTSESERWYRLATSAIRRAGGDARLDRPRDDGARDDAAPGGQLSALARRGEAERRGARDRRGGEHGRARASPPRPRERELRPRRRRRGPAQP
jgi:hypothetical protein